MIMTTKTEINKTKVIVSGGGTGGHIFPAISIANAIKQLRPDAEILFVGADNRMEMQRVPEAGYNIIGLPIAGFDRKHLWKNFSVLIKIARCQWKARRIIKEFKPQVAVGVGGYASGPTLNTAAMMGIPTIIQEQNSYAGVTNKLLAKKAKKICVAYKGMERFFDADKIILTGNPVRQNLLNNNMSKEEAIESFGLSPSLKTVLVLGGSLGARTINNAMLGATDMLRSENGIQIIWQTGKGYISDVLNRMKAIFHEDIKDNIFPSIPNLYITEFIKDMGSAYKAADLVISRAGAGSISEFCLLQKPVILVPSPNVAEDHQTKNALALADNDAAIYVKDSEAQNLLITTALKTVKDEKRLKELSANIAKLALPNSADRIAKEVIKLIEERKR